MPKIEIFNPLIEESHYKNHDVVGVKLLEQIIIEELTRITEEKEKPAEEIANMMADVVKNTSLDVTVNEKESEDDPIEESEETAAGVQRAARKKKSETSERQEHGFINAVNTAVSQNGVINLVIGSKTLNNVVGAEKYEKATDLKKEPYTDIVIKFKDGSSTNVSAKGEHAPSIAGGGGVALKQMIPDIFKAFLEAAEAYLINNLKVKKGQLDFPEIYGKIAQEKYIDLLKGTEAMGGPVNYLYIGPMDIKVEPLKDNILKISGNLIPIEQFAADNVLYFRSRRRRKDQPFVPGKKDKDGYPLIYGKSPSKGDIGRRIVLYTEKSVPKKGLKITF